MARLSLAVGYPSRTGARTADPVQLYLGNSYQAAKAAAMNPPEGIGYAEAYRLDGQPSKRFHAPAGQPADVAAPEEPVLALETEEPVAAEPAKKRGKSAAAEDA